jgi:tetratricopeptide (TPR) repeat protein
MNAEPASVREAQDRAIEAARRGRLDEARAACAQAAAATAQLSPPDAGLALRSAYVEALITYFSRQVGPAIEALRELPARARALGDGELLAEFASTLALFCLRNGEVRSATAYARDALAEVAAAPDARYRAALALANLHQDARQPEEARRHFDLAMHAAAEAGDVLGTARVMCNQAGAQVARLRQDAAAGHPDTGAAQTAVAAVGASLDAVDRIEGAEPMPLDFLLMGEALRLAGRWPDALALFDAHLEQASQDGELPELVVARADRAVCLLELGRVDEALASARAAVASLDETSPSDTRAVAHDALARALERAGEPEAANHRALAQASWDIRAREQRDVARLMATPHEPDHTGRP